MSDSFRRSGRLAARRHRAKTKSQPQPRPRPRPRPRKQKKRETTARSPNLPRTGILDLPSELRQMIVRNLIHAARGPEVYVGIGSRWPVMIYRTWNRRTPEPHFRSSVTDTTELGSTRDYWPSSSEQDWVPAYRKLRPLMACKALYHEATAVFFQEKHFVLGSSTYAHAWLRRIGQRNQVNLRNIRLKIHKELTFTGDINASGSLWIEVLKKLGRSARELRVLGFQFDEDVDLWRSTLLKSFLRMKSFQNVKQIDIFHRVLPRRADSEEFLAMMAASTGCASVRCLELSEPVEGGPRLIRRAFRDYTGQLQVS